jgi:DNA-binding transcriptional ArsR family regulator
MNSEDTEANFDLNEVFSKASDLFSLMASPSRLKIMHFLCEGEQPVNQITQFVGSSQANVSQQLALLYRSGVLAKRREGANTFYRIQSEQAIAVCRSVCTQIAIELGEVNS